MYKYFIELGTSSDVEEFTEACSRIPSEVILRGKDEYGSDWSLSAKSLLCSVVMNTRLQKHREHTAHEVDWGTIYVECEDDVYALISKFVV